MGNYAFEYYAEDAVFPSTNSTQASAVYGPTGVEFTGTYFGVDVEMLAAALRVVVIDDGVPIVIPPASSLSRCQVLIRTRDEGGFLQGGVVVNLRFVKLLPLSTRDAVIVPQGLSVTTDANGAAVVELPRLAQYTATYVLPSGKRKEANFTTPDAASYTVVEPEYSPDWSCD